MRLDTETRSPGSGKVSTDSAACSLLHRRRRRLLLLRLLLLRRRRLLLHHQASLLVGAQMTLREGGVLFADWNRLWY